MKGFIEFIRERGVVGFAVGFILGGAVTKLVSSFVDDIINPMLGVGLGFTKELNREYIQIGQAKIAWGNFTANLIDFIILAVVVYSIFKVLKMEKLDVGKEEKKK